MVDSDNAYAKIDLVGNSVCVEYLGKQDIGEAADDQSYFTKPENGKYCYCQMTGPETSSWMFENEYKDYETCILNCAYDCAEDISNNKNKIGTNMFETVDYGGGSSSGNAVITTQTYVDNALNAKQAKITTTGTNKLMTYGASTGATPGSRDIVSTLGTSTTATTVPTVGPIVTGINTKQDAVNGRANYVITGTGTVGTVGEKPVYSATTNYANALVTAQTINAAVANAANSELTCVDNDCLLWQINTTTPSGLSTRIYLDTLINGTSSCYRRSDGQVDSDGTCNADTLSYLGASGNKSGKWGVVFPYGDVSGISVCSTISASTLGTVATNVQSATLDNQYAQHNEAISGYQYCWCKMENPTVSGSPWVFVYNTLQAANCPGTCAILCSNDVQNKSTFRMAVFGN